MATIQRKTKIYASSADQIPGRQIACRVHHPWPSESMVDTRKLPPGLYMVLADKEADLWHLIDECPRCGCQRYQDMPGRRYVNGPWKRRYDRDWVKTGMKFTSRDALQENMLRNEAKFAALAQQARQRRSLVGDEIPGAHDPLTGGDG